MARRRALRRATTRAALSAGVAAALALPAACGIFPSVDGLTGGDGAAPFDAPPDGAPGDGGAQGDASDGAARDAADAGAPGDGGCPSSGRGPSMVVAGAFCIDSTEVTAAEYAVFLAGASTAGQPAQCAWNTAFAPRTNGGCVYDPIGHPNLPVSCVDWCDALAFCAWSGKRLCGAIGGGAVPVAAFGDASVSQWTSACALGGAHVYPYGDAYDGARGCNGADAAPASPPYIVDVGSRAGCVGGYPGIFDMSGNVWEWVDACMPCGDGGQCCLTQGGSYENSAPNLQCAAPNPIFPPIDTQDVANGFRCCSP